jgi:uncharacterized protein
MNSWVLAAPAWTGLTVLGATALGASLIGSVTGGGVTAILLPVLVLYFGIHEAVPIVTSLLVVASVSRVVAYRRDLDLPVVGWFSLGSLPATVLGTILFTATAPGILTRLFGAVLVAAVVWRRLQPRPPDHFGKLWFIPLGVAFGFLSGMSSAMASMPAPFFLAYGLRKGGYVGTIGLSVFLGQLAKLWVFGCASFLTTPVLVNSLALAPFVIGGTALGKTVLTRMSAAAFVPVIEIFMVASGLLFMIRG